MKPNICQLVAPISLSGDGEIPQRFQGVAYSGGIATPCYWGASVIDLASTTVSPPLPLLFRHDQDMLSVGVVRTIVNTGSEITDSGDLHVDLEDDGGVYAKGIAIRSKRGEPYEQSIGLYDFSEEEVPPQKTVQVNGRTFTGPITVMRGGTIREITIAPLGADPHTNAAVFAATTQTEGRMPEVDPKVAELTAELNGIKPKLSDATRRAETAEADVTRLKAELSAAQSALTVARTEQVKALFTDCGLPHDDAQVTAFLAMSEPTFVAVSTSMRAAKGTQSLPPGNLFQNKAKVDEQQGAGAQFTPPKLKPIRDLYHGRSRRQEG